MLVPSARCNARTKGLVFPRAVGILVLTSVASTAAQSVPSRGLGSWLSGAPVDEGETALRDALGRTAATPTKAAAALLGVSAAHPGTKVSGLARIGAAWVLVDAGKYQEAVPLLRHPDISLTNLQDRAFFLLARAYEAGGDLPNAGHSYLAAADVRVDSPVVCPALVRAGEVLGRMGDVAKTTEVLSRTLSSCPSLAASTLLRLGTVLEGRHDLAAAAAAFDRLDHEYPATSEAREAGAALGSLRSFLPPLDTERRLERDLRKASALFTAGRYAQAVAALQAVRALKPPPEDNDLVSARLCESLLGLGRLGESESQFTHISASSPYKAEAAYQLARYSARRTGRTSSYESIVSEFPTSPWAEEALFDLANFYQKDALDERALPYYRRLLDDFPDGHYLERAAWHVGWADYRAKRFEEAANILERTARLRTSRWSTPGFLYWAGRTRLELKQDDRGRQLLEETVHRYKHTYHGMRARETLAHLPRVASAGSLELRSVTPEPPEQLPNLPRIRDLLLLERPEEALEELRSGPSSPAVQATIAWIEWHRGHLRPAIIAMTQAHPEFIGDAGDQLPEEVWRILYPLEFEGELRARASAAGLDPALLAALICQESTFDPTALSRAGARGLMQVIPPTGRVLARTLRIPFRPASLFDPKVSLDFGTTYLRQMLDRFDGRAERALAAYNAGPHRVEAWTASNPQMSAEEFIESIPYTETRSYVMTILAAQEQYRRIYSLSAVSVPAANASIAGTSHP